MFSPAAGAAGAGAAFETILCSTGQHCELLADALATFGLESTTSSARCATTRSPRTSPGPSGWVSDLCRRLRPDLVLVQGDTTTTMAAGLAAFHSARSSPTWRRGCGPTTTARPGPRRPIGASRRRGRPALRAQRARGGEPDEGGCRPPTTCTSPGTRGSTPCTGRSHSPRSSPAPSAGERRGRGHRPSTREHARRRRGDRARGARLAESHPDALSVRAPSGSTRRARAPRRARRLPTRQHRAPGAARLRVLRAAPRRLVPRPHRLRRDPGRGPALGKPVLVVNPRTARQEPLSVGTAQSSARPRTRSSPPRVALRGPGAVRAHGHSTRSLRRRTPASGSPTCSPTR